MPALFAGDPGLELCNTWAGWEAPPDPQSRLPVDDRREYLADFDRFAVWTGHVRLLRPQQVQQLRRLGKRHPGPATRTLREAWRLRGALHDVLLDPEDEQSFATVARFADRAARESRLTRGGEAPARRLLPDSAGHALGLLAVAQAAERLLCDPVSASVKACPGEDCGWLFLDTRGRRRWCSMSSCGNRAKVRAHAARR